MGDQTAMMAAPYRFDSSVLLDALDSRLEGLTAEEAAVRLQRWGANRLPTPPRPSWLGQFLRQFRDPLIYVLLAAFLVTLLLGHLLDGTVIFAVLFLNALIGALQEGKAENALAAIRKILRLQATVRRDGVWQTVDAEELVPGDILRLRSGDRVPADLRILTALGLRADESLLSGESLPSDKSPAIIAGDVPLADRHNLLYAGSYLQAGRAEALVIATGSATEIGRIQGLLQGVPSIQTPLTRQMQRFSKALALLVLILSLWMVGFGLARQSLPPFELFLAVISFAVAIIPEGLPAILTITLAIGVERMARRRVITRRLNAIETLGSVSVICTDKTGTLTRNEMFARGLRTLAAFYEATGEGYAPVGTLAGAEGEDVARYAALEVLSLANDSSLQELDGVWRVVGEPTEGALRALGAKAGFPEQGYRRLGAIPFESSHKFMAVLVQCPHGERRVLLKGAPDRVLERCSRVLQADGTEQAIDPVFWQGQMQQMGSAGLRVLALAHRAASTQEHLRLEDLGQGFTLLALVGMVDPPRPEAISAIAECRRAGIQVKMITGDHAATALAIGQEMGLFAGQVPQVLTGKEIDRIAPADLAAAVLATQVFARTSPEHKLRLVEALQAQGDVVAMTGDGVNDAPALKRADVGIAMGVKGSEAAKEAADIVLADDNFASIASAVAEGRAIYDNLRKAILFILPTNGAQGLVMLLVVVAGLQLPLLPLQILWVNLLIAVTLALSLAFEPAEAGIMERPPRNPQVTLLDRRFFLRVILVSLSIAGASMATFYEEIALSLGTETARSMAVTTLVLCQAFYLFNVRHLRSGVSAWRSLFRNSVSWLALLVLLLLQLGFLYLPVLQQIFHSHSLSLRHWGIAVLIAGGVFLLMELEQYFLDRSG
ncbi:HAD-IC family P-type ATPase [Acidithiobacillus sp.]|uniref:cation-translocating P-type ATPase n=1 Tax=Acidithiobacillus sp. TaxID=1872118 RepID=UPI0032AEEF1F